MSNSIRIYVDHWEDYENIGDIAMLLNAFRRLELHFGNCRFVIPRSPNKTGEIKYDGNVTTVFPPHLEIIVCSAKLQDIYSLLQNRFGLKSLMPQLSHLFFLDVAKSIINFKYFFYALGVRAVFSKPFRSTLEEIKKCQVYFAVGDGSINDYWLDGIILKSWMLKFVRRFVSVSVLSSQGIGPLNPPWARKRLIHAMQSLDVLSFRDCNSYGKAFVESEGLKGVPYNIVGDEAFSLPIASQKEIWDVLNGVGIAHGEQFIIVNFRNTDITKDTTFLWDKTAELLDKIITSINRSVVFMPMSKGDAYGRDLHTAQHIKGMMKQNAARFFVLEPMDDPGLVKGIVGQARYSLGLSYHLHVFSLSQGHPTLALYTGDYYKIKSEGIVSYYGIPSRAIDFADTSIEQILDYVREIEMRYEEACAHIQDVNNAIREINDWTIVTAKNLLLKKVFFQRSNCMAFIKK